MLGEIDSLISIITRLFKLGKNSHVQLSVDRFKQLIAEHDFAIGQLPSLLPDNLKQSMQAFGSDELIASNLTDELLAWTSQAFGIRREWLEGADDVIYKSQLFGYKNIDGLFRQVEELGLMNIQTTMYIFTSGLLDEKARSKLWVTLEIPFDPDNEEDEHTKYIPLSDKWIWDHANSRNHLIHIANEFYKREGHSTPVYKVSPSMMERMQRREVIPNVHHLKQCKYYADGLG